MCSGDDVTRARKKRSRARAVRNDGIHFMLGTRRSDRLPLHWGMTIAVDPFWGVVAEVTGRLFRLQRTAAPMQVLRRIKELLGER